MEQKVDYHIHTTYSDGTMEPVDVVKKFSGEGYDIIAITDHDGVGGIPEAMIAGKALNIRVVGGIEIASHYNTDDCSAELHILGYNIDDKNERLLTAIEKIRRWRGERNEKIIERAREMGFPLTESDIPRKHGGFIGKPDFARALAVKYPDCDPDEVFCGILKQTVSAYEAIDVIREANGIPVLAHPAKTRELALHTEGFFDRLFPVIRDLRKHGLKGLECFHPSADDEESIELVGIAEKLHLHITRGSDFHGL